MQKGTRKNKCLDCGKDIYRYAKRCRSCSKKGVRRTGKQASNYKHGKYTIKHLCKGCKKEITPMTKYGYCRSCVPRKSKEESPSWKGGKNKCVDCGVLLSDRYCKRCVICSNKIKVGVKRPPEIGRKISKALTGKRNGMFGRFGKEHPAYRHGNAYEPYSLDFPKTKVLIRERDKNICQICGMTEKANGRKLDVHHIDYDKKNSNWGNLITLCHSCHMKTNGTKKTRVYWSEFFKLKKAQIPFYHSSGFNKPEELNETKKINDKGDKNDDSRTTTDVK